MMLDVSDREKIAIARLHLDTIRSKLASGLFYSTDDQQDALDSANRLIEILKTIAPTPAEAAE